LKKYGSTEKENLAPGNTAMGQEGGTKKVDVSEAGGGGKPGREKKRKGTIGCAQTEGR